MLELSILIGLVAAGGALTFVFDTNNDVADPPRNEQEPNGDVDGRLLEPQPTDEDSAFDFVLTDTGSAEWLEDVVQVVSASDELLNLSDEVPVLITNGETADNVDTSGLSNVIVYSGEADTVTGGDMNGVFISISSGGASVSGGETDGIFLANGEGDTVYAGDGEDLLISGDKGSFLDGGAGDDTIYGSPSDLLVNLPHTSIENYVDQGIDTLQGGAGNDIIYAASGDQISGGEGNDTFHIFGMGASILDYSAEDDNCVIAIEDTKLFPDGIKEYDGKKWETLENEEEVEVYFDGELVLSVSRSEGMHISLEIGSVAAPERFNIFSIEPTVGSGIVIAPFSNV